ncbi:MAG: AmmeMemoRadiSam system protein A [Coriobacteriia bacterium]|nr:AmmeMemoRadiSam system protein A [Coriobacteriia bacterium]
MSGVFGVIAPHPPIMVPEVGGRDAEVTSASMRALAEAARMLERFDPDTVVVMSPHSPGLADAFVVETASRLAGTLAQFRAPEVSLSYDGDPALAQQLLARLDERGVPGLDRATVPTLRSGELDHGVLVPMSFLDRSGRWPVLALSLSYLPYDQHRILGEELAGAAADLGRRIAFVASGDCSHRLTREAPAGYSPRGQELDSQLVSLIEASDFEGLERLDPSLVEAGGECGLRSFITLGGAARPAHARVLSYEGPWGVGYLTALINEEFVASDTPAAGDKGGVAGSHEHPIVILARRAIEAYVTRAEVLEPASLDDESLPDRAGAFVSLHRGRNLRGCIGTISPTRDTLEEEVVRNAIEAATHDPRFPELESPELVDLDIKVDVLHAPEECSFEDLEPSTYGVIVTCGWRRGLLLPDLEGVDTPQQQISIACRKAGIETGEKVALERFKVDRYA